MKRAILLFLSMILVTGNVWSQGGLTPFDFTVSPTSINIKKYGAESFEITTSKDWIVSCSANWIAIHTTSGMANKTATFVVYFYSQKNDTSQARTANIEVSSGDVTKTIKVTQNVYKDDVKATHTSTENNKGTIDLYIDMPSSNLLTGEFTVTMPDVLSLDKENTVLAQEFQNNNSLDITDMENGSWIFTISPNVSTGGSSGNNFIKIATIAYIIDDDAATGKYDVSISNLEFTLSNNTTIKESKVNVSVSYTSSVGNSFMDNTVKVIYNNNNLSVNSPDKERVDIYSITGVLIFSQQKQEGEIKFNINGLPAGVAFVRGSTGWVEKIIIR